MSKQVDEKVVSMQFDNKHFESNVQTTLGTLEKLKQGLKLDGASKGLEDVNAAAKKTDMSGLASGVETVRTKFSALQVIGVTALSNITNSAVNAGKRIVSALTIDPIKTGFQEYETQINAVQTILANTESKGTTLQQVNSALDTLNTYADKTIYNFTEMTKNIGTFTAAGVDLDTSVNAIQGIANLAAVSGSTSQQASTAMYQLSQALSSGTVKLMDWNSVVNAGMGGQVFQDALKETARNHGIAIDDMIKKQGSFRETLKDGWLTSEVLTETLSHFTMAAEEGTEQWKAYKKSLMDEGYTAKQAEEIIRLSNTATNAATKVKTFTQLWDTLKESAQSGWTQTWEIIMGDFEEAKGFLTEVSDKIGGMISASAEARNAVLSEGLSSGWKQLLGAGIADEAGYKDTLNKVAKDHGVSIDKMVKAEKKLDSSLSDTEAYQKALTKGIKDGSITSDMFSESVHKMADKMSKMSAEELAAAGYTQEHVTKIKELSKGLKDGSISMDDFTNKMTRASGRENIIQALWNAFDGLMSVVEPIKNAFSEIFDPITGDQIYSFTEALVKFTEKLTLSEGTADNLKRTFKGVFALLDIGVQVIKALFGGFAKLVGYVAPAGDGILGFTANIGDFIVKIDEAIKSSDLFNNIIEKIGSFLKPVADGVRSFASSISESFSKIGNKGAERLGPLSMLAQALKVVFFGLGKVIQAIAPWFFKLATNIGEVVASLVDNIANAIQDADYNAIFDIINGGIISAIGIFIAKFIKSGGDILDNAGGFLENIKEILGGVGDALKAFTGQIKANTLKTIATSIAILAASLFVLSLIDSEKMTDSLAAVTALFIELFGAMSIFGKLSEGKGFDSIGKISRAMLTLSGALLVLAVAMKIMSTMSWSEMGVGLISITVGLGVLVAAVNLLPDKKVKEAAKAIKKLSTSLLIFAVAMKIMSTMSWSEMGVGLISITVGLGALVGAVNLLPDKKVKKAAKAIKKLSTSLVIFAIAMKIMSSMSWQEMGVGLITTVVGLGALVGAVNLLPKDNMTKAAKAIQKLSAALLIFAIAMKIMGSLSWNELAVGLVGLVVGLRALVAAVRLLPKNMASRAMGILVMSTAMVILAKALTKMGSMSWGEVAKGLVALGGSLLIMSLGVHAMKGALSGVAAMFVVSTALAILAPVLKILGSMSWEEIGKGLTVLAGAFLILGIAGYALAGAVLPILGLAGAIALIGVGIAAAGAGVMLFAAGLTALAVALTASGGAIVIFVSSIIGLIPYLIEQIGVGIIKFCEVIAGSADAICKAVTVIIVALVDALVTCIPVIVDGLLQLIVSLMEALATYTPMIVGYLFDFIIGIINAIAEKLPDLIQAGVNLLMTLFQGVIDALKSIDPTVLVNSILAIGMLTALVAALAGIALMTPAALVGVIGLGAVVSELGILLAAIGALSQIPGLKWLVEQGGEFMQLVGAAIGKFIGGIVGGVAQGISAALPQIGSDLSTFMTNVQPFIDGAKSIDPSALEGVKTLVGVVMAITAANVLESITSWVTGGSSIAKFASELPVLGMGLNAFSMAIAGMDASAVKSAADAAKAIAEMSSYIPNEGGMVAWFTGENSLAKFASELPILGAGLKSFSLSIAGMDAEAVTAAAGAAKTIAEMSSYIPNEGGMVAWFTGENSLAKFASELPILGMGLRMFSLSIAGMDAAAVTAAAGAAKAIAEMTAQIPNEGGVSAWFAGENSLSKFAMELPALGNGLRMFSLAIAGMDAEAIKSATGAAKSIAEMTACIPNEGGVSAWFAGENSLSKFAMELPVLGMGLKLFSLAIAGMDSEAVKTAAGAAKAIAEMTACIPNEGGVVAWFTGENSVSKFAGELPTLGKGLKKFAKELEGANVETLATAAQAGKHLAQMTETTPKDTSKLISFGENLTTFANHLKSFIGTVSGVNSDNVNGAIDKTKKLISLAKTLAETNISSLSTFGTSLKSIAKDGVKGFVAEFKSETPKADIKKAATAMLESFIKGLNDKAGDVKKKAKEVVNKAVDGIEEVDFEAKGKTSGNDLGKGLVLGIEAKYDSAYKAGYKLGQKAVKGEKDGQKSKSPSKLTIQAGKWLGEGLIIGIDKMGTAVYNSGKSMGKTAVNSISKAISNISDIVNSDIDSQPTIRPVLDLSDVKSGAGAIGDMLSTRRTLSIDTSSVGVISASMAGFQNGNSDDVVSAIKGLRKDISNMPRESISIDGISYNDDSNISDAVRTLVRAVRVEGRV